MKIVAVSSDFWYTCRYFPLGNAKAWQFIDCLSCLRAKRKIQEAHFIIWHSLLALCHHLFVNLWLPLLFFCLAISVSISCLIHQWIFVDLSTFSILSLLTFALSLSVCLFSLCVFTDFSVVDFSIFLFHLTHFRLRVSRLFDSIFLAKQNFTFFLLFRPIPAATLCLLIYPPNYINIHAYTSNKTLYPALYNVYVLLLLFLSVNSEWK